MIIPLNIHVPMAFTRNGGTWQASRMLQFLLSVVQICNHLPLIHSSPLCRCFPGDACWPSQLIWQNLNGSVHGRLVATLPLGAPCHDPVYKPAICKSLQSNWLEPDQHYDSSSSVMAPFFANQSCDPFTPQSTPCTLGNYVDYAINVAQPSDISKGIAFASKYNIRLVIRNTGHDYLGKSTGAGSLAIWTHHLKGIDFLDYKSPYYTGKAIKMGAGAQGFEAYSAADKMSFAVVGGECPTVGLAGGYTQGGGHSPLASKYGLAADQTLEWEVIDGRGQFLRASRTENQDLYWALSGGGGGTYGVVWSLTSKVHEDIPVSAANLTFTNQGVSAERFYAAVGAYHESLASIVDAGVMSVAFYTNTSFAISPMTAPGVSKAQLAQLLQPYLTKLWDLGVEYSFTLRQFSGYLPAFTAMQPAIEVGTAQYGGRLIPRSLVEKNNSDLTAAFRSIIEGGGGIATVGLSVSKSVAGDVHNAVLPAWRDTLLDVVVTTPWSFTAPLSDMVALQRRMTEVYIPTLAALTPGGGCYLNEGDFLEPNWQHVFYGANYRRLREIKKRFDPEDVFYAPTAVGSDEWVVTDGGRLCRV